MPGRNGTGPAGVGPMTGKGMGLCHSTDVRYNGIRCGMGFGHHRGHGRGLGLGLGAPAQTVEISKERLLAYREALSNRISSIDKQLEDM